ncbi:hypothetical protein CPC08DRAFT_727094 [Agrocybe pediades]|nr:hypothetical protein CPC08DRAFT_727094 [Agrocybe pediades]
MDSYHISESPSPVDPQSELSSFPSQERFLHSDVNSYPVEDRVLPLTDSGSDHPSSKQQDKYSPPPNQQNSLLDQRRMSEPAALSGPGLYTSPPDYSTSRSNQDYPFAFQPPPLRPSNPSLYVPTLHRGASTGSLRDLRHHHFEYPPQQAEWKQDDSRHREHHPEYFNHRGDILDEPISPMHPTFAHGLNGSPTSGLPYSPINDNFYGPSPPNTGTSTSSSIAPLSPSRSISQHLQRSLNELGADGIDRKTYSFVALPGNAVKKRPRRRYDEIERLYLCSWPDCNKSYGTLNHLNAHVTMQKHGPKRSPNEFKELRKQWRKAKKEQEALAAQMRRESYSDSYDDHPAFGHRYMSSHMQQRPHSSHHPGLGLPSSVNMGSSDRYSIAMDDPRYPQHDRDDGMGAYDQMSARQRYGNLQAASWQSGSNLSSRSNVNYSASAMSSQHVHHSQLPQLAIHSRLPGEQNESMSHLNRLPQNSTLLTPLPGYSTSSLMPPLQNGNGSVAYTADGYEIYEDDNGRPSTGHASIGSMGHGSGDDFEHPQ